MTNRITLMEKDAHKLKQSAQSLRSDAEKFVGNHSILDHEIELAIRDMVGLDHTEDSLRSNINAQIKMSIRESIDICGEETFLSLVKEETGVDIQEADAPQIQTIVSHIVPPIPRSTIVPAAVILAFKTFIPEARDIKNWDSDTVCNLIQGVHAQMKILQGELDDLKERLLANDEVQVIRPPAKRVRPSLNQTSSHVSRRGSRTLDLYNADSESEVEIIDSEGDADIDGNAEESLADILAKNETLESKLHLADTQLNMKIDENRNLKRLLLYNFQYGLQIGESLVCKYWKDIEGARKSKENSATIALRSIPVILGG